MKTLSLAPLSILLACSACTPLSFSTNTKKPTPLTIAESLVNPRDAKAFEGIESERRSQLQARALTLGSILKTLAPEVSRIEIRQAPVMPTAATPEFGTFSSPQSYLDHWASQTAFQLDPNGLRDLWIHVSFKDGSELQLIATELRSDPDFNDMSVRNLLDTKTERVVKLANSFKKFPVLDDQGTLRVLPLSEAMGQAWFQVLGITTSPEELSDYFETGVLQHGYVLENQVFYGVTAL